MDNLTPSGCIRLSAKAQSKLAGENAAKAWQWALEQAEAMPSVVVGGRR
jgi:hypothetical protein